MIITERSMRRRLAFYRTSPTNPIFVTKSQRRIAWMLLLLLLLLLPAWAPSASRIGWSCAGTRNGHYKSLRESLRQKVNHFASAVAWQNHFHVFHLVLLINAVADNFASAADYRGESSRLRPGRRDLAGFPLRPQTGEAGKVGGGGGAGNHYRER